MTVCGVILRVERQPGRWVEWVCTLPPHEGPDHEARQVLGGGQLGNLLMAWHGTAATSTAVQQAGQQAPPTRGNPKH